MVGLRIKKGLVAGVLGLGMTLLGSSVASAASVPMVLSDSAQFAGNVTPGPTPGTYMFSSTRCVLKSDTDTTAAVPCQLSSRFTLSSTGNGSGSATLTSSDGTTKWNFTLTPVSTTTLAMKGRGTEADSPENGVPSPMYPATMRGRVTRTSATTASGNVAVYEATTQP
jgi:hypothetical protein